MPPNSVFPHLFHHLDRNWLHSRLISSSKMRATLRYSIALSLLALGCSLSKRHVLKAHAHSTLPSQLRRRHNQESLSSGIGQRYLQASTWETITYDDFETGWGSFAGGGADADRIEGKQLKHIHQGQAALRIRNGSSSSYVSHATNHDVSDYSDLRVSFWFRPRRTERNESFVLEYSSDGGKTWAIVKREALDS